MSNNKKVLLIPTPTKNQSFTELLFIIYTFLFFTIGFLLLFFTKEVSLLTMFGEQVKATLAVEQFFGSFLILLSAFLFSIRNLEGQVIFNCISALILAGFINLYLLFLLSENIKLPTIYFVFQIIMQLTFFVVFFEQVRRKQ